MGEPERARYWRETIMGWSRRQLAPRIGLSVDAIRRYEEGGIADDRLWLRYRLACAAVTMGVSFDWTTATVMSFGGVTVALRPAETP